MTYKDLLEITTADNCTSLLREVLNLSFQISKGYKNEFLTPEHVVLSIVKLTEFEDFVKEEKKDYEYIQNELNNYIENLDSISDNEPYNPTISHVLEQLFTTYLRECEEDNELLSVMDFLYPTLSENPNLYASVLLRNVMGYDIDDWFQKLNEHFAFDQIEGLNWDKKRLAEKDDESIDDETIIPGEALYNQLMSAINSMQQHSTQNQSQKKEPWEEWVTCLSYTFHTHNPLIGRDAELDRTLQILCRKDKNNPLFIGEPGVGKTALIYGLADRFHKDEVPERLHGYHIYSCNIGSLLAGASFHGETENRIKSVMEGLKSRGNSILYIDELHGIMGNESNGSQNIANMLKPYLEDGSIRFIGSTTYQDFNRYISKDKSIVRRFQQIDILEPSVDDTVKIVEGLIPHYEEHHGVKYERDAIRYAVERSAALIADRFLPDKAIDIIDEAGAYREMHPLHNKKGGKMSAGRQKVGKDIIDEILCKVCKINANALKQEGNEQLRELDKRISQQIFGQDEAISQVVRAVKLAKAGLTLGDKPLASLLFVGPTGVGKTEVCKVLAQELGIELIRFDMSEYTEKHTVAKLIGSPAGYVGYDDGGLLTDAVRKTPNCVLLFDEIEKAHSDIYNILLQVMDYAKLTDNKGNKADFRNTIVILTSNAGAQYASQASVGFSGGQTKGQAMLSSVRKIFKPEFLNRLSGTVVFNDMNEQMAALILDKKLNQLRTLLTARNVTLILSDEARNYLLTHGFTQQYGAREMDRIIQRDLTSLLMDELLFGSLKGGGTAHIGLDSSDNKLVLKK